MAVFVQGILEHSAFVLGYYSEHYMIHFCSVKVAVLKFISVDKEQERQIGG